MEIDKGKFKKETAVYKELHIIEEAVYVGLSYIPYKRFCHSRNI